MLESGVISDIALIFSTYTSFDNQLNRILEIVGAHLGISRCYIHIAALDETTPGSTHEWCAQGIGSTIDYFQRIPFSLQPAWENSFGNEPVIAVNDVKELPPEIRTILEEQGIRAIILAPLLIENCVHGFIGFDECHFPRKWRKIEIETLKTILGIITTAYKKEILTQQLSGSEENFRRLFNTIEDILLVGDLDGKLIYANEGACQKLGFSLDEIQQMRILDLQPVAKREEIGRIQAAMFRKEPASFQLELEARNGKILPVDTRVWFGKWNKQDSIYTLSKDLSAEQAALQKFEKLFRNNPAAMAISDLDNRRFIDINEAFTAILGYTREEVIGRTGREIHLFDDSEQWKTTREILVRGENIRNVEITFHHKNGSLVHGLLSGETIESHDQQFLLTLLVDVTEKVNLQTALAAEHRRITNIIDSTGLGTWEWNIKTGEIRLNDRWAEILGYTLADLGTTTLDTWKRLVHPDDLKATLHKLDLHLNDTVATYEAELRMRHKNGSWIWVSARGKIIERDEQNRPLQVYGIHTDITEKKVIADRVQELSIRDPLTGLYSRRYIFDRLDEISAEYLRRGRNFCVSLIDIDHFKKVNDRYGHMAGDFVLKEFSSDIKSTIRPYDLLGRYGGEELIVVTTSAGKPETTSMLERILSIIREKVYIYQDHGIRVAFSCGIAESSEFPLESFSVETMINASDRRLYLAKNNGRNCCIDHD